MTYDTNLSISETVLRRTTVGSTEIWYCLQQPVSTSYATVTMTNYYICSLTVPASAGYLYYTHNPKESLYNLVIYIILESPLDENLSKHIMSLVMALGKFLFIRTSYYVYSNVVCLQFNVKYNDIVSFFRSRILHRFEQLCDLEPIIFDYIY